MQGPRCNHCRQRGESCDLVSRMLSTDPRLFRTTTTLLLPACPSLKSLEEPALVGLFSDVTADSISLVTEARRFWALEIPRQAERNAFLRHGVSALAALHIAKRSPDMADSAFSLSRRHYLCATSQFRLAVSTVNKDNGVAVFAFSLIVIMVQFSISSFTGCGLNRQLFEFSPIDELGAIRGAFYLTKSLSAFLSQSSVARIVVSKPQVHIDERTAKGIQVVEKCLSAIEPCLESKETLDALRSLRAWLTAIYTWPKSWFQIAWWPSAISAEFLNLLRQGSEPALLSYLCWCYGLQLLYHEWFLIEHARKAMRFVRERLSSKWEHKMRGVLRELDGMTPLVHK